MSQYCLASKQWKISQLVSEHKPRFRHPNKQLLYDLACSIGGFGEGKMGYSQWSSRPLPSMLPANVTEINFRDGYFDYAVNANSTIPEWHLNFANDDIFSAWATSLFAQDEIQVAEHPILIFMRMAGMQLGLSMRCVSDGEPTPILITGVQRRLSIDTTPNAQDGRPFGIYGYSFATATESQIASATKTLDPPTLSNILAIEAPSYGMGRYTSSAIEYVLNTAFAGFSAVCDVSKRDYHSREVNIHSGFWGCGAYGGNKVLMLLLQMVAAQMSGIKTLIFHIGDESGRVPYLDALEIYTSTFRDSGMQLRVLIEVIESLKFEWGISDGN